MTGSHQLLRLDEETTAALDDAGLLAVMEAVEGSLADADVIVLSDYAKGVLCDGVLDAILARMAQAGRLVIADPKRPDFAAYRGATILTPNEHEVRVATRIEADHDAEADRAGRVALDATGGEAVLVTRSAKGLTLVCRDRDALHLPTRAREVADVSGAGDTLVAALSVALGAGAALPDAAMLANATAGISVGKQGTATVSRQELLDALHLDDLVATDRKVVSLEEAIEKGRRMAPPRPEGRLRQRLLRPDPSRPCPAAERGARRLRPADRRAEHRCLGQAAEGTHPAAAERDGARHRDGLHVASRSGHPVR